ncbi:MAG TPA: DNA polymerase III subunit gamma/tau [Firmicutes bacterium]|nr:DNA polymerase III subunit gamma/tau [Bacillota bacterium]
MYLALYRKWRPKRFDDVVSQEHITTTLRNQIQNNHVAHAYIFTGSRGTGKTTCSKILAKAVNCLHPINGEPCLECEICRGIDEETLMDVVEIDAASNNGVDNIRDLRDEAGFTPAVCKYRVYIIDEVHMLSTGAFNALLKIMEEPPAYVIFILATTEIHKVPATILSRCQRFDFRRIHPRDIAQRLMRIAEEEPFTLTEEAAELIARLADGGMRDALSILDQCVAFSDQVDAAIVSSAVGIAGREYLFRLTDAVKQQDASAALQIIDTLYQQSKDLERLSAEMIQHFRDIMIVKASKHPDELIHCLPDEIEQLRAQAATLSMASVLSYIGILQQGLEKLSRTANKRLEFEMCMIRLCTPGLNSSIEGLQERIEALERKVKAGIPVQTGAADVSPSVPVRRAEPPAKQAEPAVSGHPDRPQTEIDMSQLHPVSCWAEILQSLEASDPPLVGVLNKSKAYECGDILFIESPNPMFAMLLRQDGQAKRLTEAIVQQTGKKYRLRLKSGKKQQEEQRADLIDDFARHAENLGVETTIHEAKNLS